MEALRKKFQLNQGHFENKRVSLAKIARVPSDAKKLKHDRALRIGTLLLAAFRGGVRCLGMVFELAFGRASMLRCREPGVYEEVEPFENPLQRKPF